MTFRIMTFQHSNIQHGNNHYNNIQDNDFQHNDTQLNNTQHIIMVLISGLNNSGTQNWDLIWNTQHEIPSVFDSALKVSLTCPQMLVEGGNG
jgi:hypothetical protein